MNKNKRYVFIPINVRLNEYEFYDDVITNRFFEYEKEPLALPINPRAYIDFDNIPPSLSNSKYCIVGFLEMSNKYWTEESNEILMFLQQNRLIFSSDITSDINFSSSRLFSTFQDCINWYKEKLKLNNKIKTNLFSTLGNKLKKSNEEINLDRILSTFKTSVILEKTNFTKKDFQPIFFSNDVYMQQEYVINIYKDIDNLYEFILCNFNKFIQNSSLKKEYKTIHFLDIDYKFFENFSTLEDVIIFHDYFCLLNSSSEKFKADLILSMIKQNNLKELKKIKNYIQKKEDDYILSVLIDAYYPDDQEIRKQFKNKYIKLINDFNERIANL